MFLIPPTLAVDDFYKPYLHKAEIQEHPKIKLYGYYSTNLFPGAATYTYPIEVPRGTNGLQPAISITYNSQTIKQRPGIVGAGWILTQNYIYRDVNSTLDNTTDDKYNLIFNGISYDLIYDSSDSLYHTKIESFLRIQNLTSGSNTYGKYWLVTTKDGTQYRFGYNSNSELTSNTVRIYALRWNLDQVEDTHGNKIYYSYLEDPNPEDQGTVYLSQILYNNDQKRKIEFIYESTVRPDRRLVYDQGNRLNESRRLNSINISVNGQLVRKYSFEYTNLNPEKSLSSISKIKFYGSDGTSLLHQVSFDYYNANIGFNKSTTQWISPIVFSNDDYDHGVRLVDLNNDGFIDIIKGREQTTEKKAWLNNRVNNWTESTAFAPPVYIVKSKTVYDLTSECRGSYCGDCSFDTGGECRNDKCFVWGCDYGATGRWYNYGNPIEYLEQNMDGYTARTTDADYGVRFVDFNNDGFIDILQGTSDGALKKAWANNGTGWVDVSSTFAPPVYFIQDDIDTGAQLVDFDGDGRIDILQSNNNGGVTKKAYRNNGTGWVDVSSSWVSPVYFMDANKDSGARMEDINSDGLPDIIQSSSSYGTVKKLFLNNGTGWTDYTSIWDIPVFFVTSTRPDNGVRLVDLNGDGLVDIFKGYTNGAVEREAWINNGTGWVSNNSWQPPDDFTKNGYNIGRRLTDVNGDGLADIVVAHTNASSSFYWTWIKNSITPYMLKKITNEFGGITSLNYQTSTQFNNNGTDNLSDIGFNVWIVKNVTSNNSMAGSFNTVGDYLYNYANGSYDYKDFEFSGFERVNETLPDNSLIIHYFHQDDARKSKEYRTEVYNSTGSIFSKDENVFNATNVSAGYFKVLLTSQSNYLYDGVVNNPKITNVTYSYDNYGNIISRNLIGVVNVSSDEKYERYSYVYNTTAWIVDRLSRYQLFDSDNSTKVKDIRYSYDSKPYGGIPSKGDVTEIDTWINPYTGGRHAVKYEYDSYGNVIRETGPLGRETNYRYGLRDTTFTYVDKITNALFHTTDYKYDLGTGNLLWQKQNDITTYFYYDVFGRIIKEVQPFDAEELPTKSYNYSFDGTAPESIKVSQRTSANKTFDTYFYYDGLGNFIQFKKPSDGSQQIVKNFFYDGLSRVTSEQNPYFATFNTGLTTLSATVNSTNYTFDVLGRVTFVRNPDGTNKTINFDKRTITAYDENGHRRAYVLDGYDRITNVLEYNNDPVLNWDFESDVYNTSYEYDTADNLVKITDALGNVYSFTYDSLGRRIALTDPDLGNWTYTYDLAGNLITQIQNGGGNLVTGDGYYREYDGLNQLIRIRNGSTVSSPVLEEYSYDPFGQRIKIVRNDTANTTIYTPFKELMRIKNSTGSYDFTYVYQDGVLVARVNPDGSKYFYHPDHLGSTSLITDSSGNVIENTFYSPYGELLGGGTADVKLYTGQFKDNVLCQYYYGKRYFAPCMGMFIQPDPIIKEIFNPQNLNRYSYVLNNPYKYTDPTGEIVFIPFAIYGGYLAITIGVSTVTYVTITYGPMIFEKIGQIGEKLLKPPPGPGSTTVGQEQMTTSSPPTSVPPSITPSDIGKQSTAEGVDKTVESSTHGITQAGKTTFDPKQLDTKYSKHGSQYGTKENYKNTAEDLLDSKTGGNIEGYTRSDGTIVRYNRETNDFAVKSKDGSFQTMFKPENGYEYYLKDRFGHT